MNKDAYTAGHKKGSIDGFLRGKQEGFEQGYKYATNIQLDTAPQSDPPLHEIGQMWRDWYLSEKLKDYFADPVSLLETNMACLKDTVKSTIWKLEIIAQQQIYPLILKIFKAPVMNESLIELNMYWKASHILSDFMPQIYWIQPEVNGSDIWVFMEYVQPIKGQLVFTPDHFDYIIPTLAKFHAHTYNEYFVQNEQVFTPWLPHYHSEAEITERNKRNEETKQYLDRAMNLAHLKDILSPYYSLLQSVLQKGPDYFPELIEAGLSMNHTDLQTPNIGCNNVNENNDWHIKFIDWEGAKFAPCWFDMFNLVGLFLAYRSNWRMEEEGIVHRCAHLYAAEMQKHGVTFHTDPVKLYKMAYLQRVLEKSLYLQLNWEVNGLKKGYLLQGYLEKISLWGKEVGLH